MWNTDNSTNTDRWRDVMPTYEYRCNECNALQVLSRNVDDRDNEVLCPMDSKVMDRVWNPTPTHFKTGGFYSTGN